MSRGLPEQIKVNNSGTNLYGDVPDGGANRQNTLNKLLTGGKKDKKGGAQEGTIVSQFHNASPETNATNVNLLKIAGQAQANSALDTKVNKVGGRRKKSKSRKKTKKTKKRRNTRKVVRK
jgi:hypothetical protein